MDKPIHIFRAGEHTAMSGAKLAFSEADVAATARAYDPAKHEAPIVLGHPRTDGPAHGWIASLKANGADLTAQPIQVAAEFAEDFRAGRFKKISASFYPPEHPANPVPGVYYLRHVGVLGAQPPAIKGLRQAEFADDGRDLIEIEFAENDERGLLRQLLTKLDTLFSHPGFAKGGIASKPDSITVHPDTDRGAHFSETSQQESDMTPEEIKAAEDKLAAQKKDLDARAAAIADSEKKAQRREAVDFAETLIKNGQLKPVKKNHLVELQMRLAESDQKICFSESDEEVKANPVASLQAFLQDALPKDIEFGEQAADYEATQAGTTGFVTPERASVDAAGLALHHKALAYAEANNVDYETAVTRVSG